MLALIAWTPSAAEQSAIGLSEIDGRTWLIDSSGQPFFAHGVTHLNTRHTENVVGVAEAIRELGFNAFGYGCPPVLKATLPYLDGRQFVPMSLYRTTDKSFGFVDIFDPSVQAELEQAMEAMCRANRDNPNLIGYYWTDMGAWHLDNPTGQNWVDHIRDLPVDSPGQNVYQRFLSSWSGDDTAALDLAFLRRIAAEYFRGLGESNRRFDPDHLIFGDRFSFDTSIPEVLEEIMPYVDAIAVQPRFNPGFPRKEYDRIHRITGKPIIICDFAIRFEEAGKTIRGWKPQKSPKLAGERYAEYVREALATPYIIGAFWCNPINSIPGFAKAGVKQGLFDVGLIPRPELNAAIKELNRHIAESTPPGPIKIN